MPILLSVQELEPGMFLSPSVVNDYNVLLPGGRRLSTNDIAALQRRYPDMMVQVGNPVLDDFVEFQDDTRDIEVSREVRQRIKASTQKISESIRNGTDLKAENIAGIQRLLEEVMTYLRDNPVSLAILEQTSQSHEGFQEHSANVFYLCLVMGNTIRNYIKTERERLSAAKTLDNALDMTPLAMASFFFDIGMIGLENLMNQEEPLTPEDVEKIRRHPLTALEMLPDNFPPMALLAIRQHHENMDGTGYPDGIPGSRINIFSRILRTADAFCAATAHRAYRKAKSPVRTLYEMLYSNFRHHYDPVVLKVLANIMKPFPIGAKIHFSNGQTGVVVRQNPKNPFQPEVVMAFDELGDAIPQESLQPTFIPQQQKDLRMETYCDEDISYANDIQFSSLQESREDLLQLEYASEELFDLMYP